MSGYQVSPLGDDIVDLADLCRQVQARVHTALETEEPVLLLSDPPFVSQESSAFALRCQLWGIASAVLAGIAVFVYWPAGLVIGGICILLWVAFWFTQLTKVGPARRKLRACRVLPAVVVQAFDGGYRPPDGDANSRPFTGVVVFRFEEPDGAPSLGELAGAVFDAKTGPTGGPLGDLKRLLVTGDTAFEHETVRLPRGLAGSEQTYATPCLWVRDNDLRNGYLSTKLVLILAHPDHPEHVTAVPLVFWQGRRSFELLGARP